MLVIIRITQAWTCFITQRLCYRLRFLNSNLFRLFNRGMLTDDIMESFIVLAWMIKCLAEAASTRLPDLCNRLLIDVVFVLMVTEFGSSSLAKISTKTRAQSGLVPATMWWSMQMGTPLQYATCNFGEARRRSIGKFLVGKSYPYWNGVKLLFLEICVISPSLKNQRMAVNKPWPIFKNLLAIFKGFELEHKEAIRSRVN